MKVPYLALGWQAAGTRMVAKHSGGQAFVELWTALANRDSVAAGAAIGASVGSVIPIAGTLVGGIIGGAVGGIVGSGAGEKAYDAGKKVVGKVLSFFD